ncbi:5-formyltetrahydrofolate cyclo-ligase [Aerococcus urinaeequi]|uniref:5-formyltetrahydrofolate cyclo-ligase n=1 Tax=Aerococcus urinaeequi TaxID=51665 RepID=UPI002282ACFB|nr:5-formyltetrahydrofolate cyclo-ligase [Aerococcus urinaeequi]MCY7731721.1 5-formyltetrahydrofolate cyclo-ligase [Aerococcus urinaeequi]
MTEEMKELTEKMKTILDKKDIRDQTFKYWAALPEVDRIALQADIYAQLFTNEAFIQADTITTTIAHPGEIDTKPIIDYALTIGKKIYVPKTYSKRQMAFAKYQGMDALKKTKFGIYEPTAEADFIEKDAIDLMIVPGLFFRPDGYRVGHGGGFYDIFLADYPGNKIALAFPGMVSDKVTFEIDDFDIPVDQIIVGEI